MKYYIIAGEASGDLHGSNLIRGLLASDPDAEIRFWGGDEMTEAAGGKGTRVKHYKEASIMGFWEVVKNLRTILTRMKFCKRDIADYRPDVLILIDYPGFNLAMAQFVHEQREKPDSGLGNTQVFYYIAPKVWAWKEKRVNRIRKYVDKLFIIFPFEIEFFRKHGIEPYYAGNPIMDSIAKRKEEVSQNGKREQFFTENGLDPQKPLVALVAGSRASEIEYVLPTMVQVAERFPEHQFVVTGVPWLERSLYDKHMAGSNVRFVCNQTYETICYSAAALVTSGTASLETALLGIPQVVCIKGSGVTIWIARKLVGDRIKFISLANLIMDREIFRELIQQDYNVEETAKELRAVLPGGAKREKMLRDYAELQSQMGEPGASERVAAEMVKTLKTR